MQNEVESYLKSYIQIINAFNYNDDNTIPLCAAESTLSEFAKIPLMSGLQERYIRGSARNFDWEKNFSGSEFIYPLYEKITEVCSELFKCQYADPRPLSGMNATISLLMSITKFGDNILLLPSDAGGHESFPPICKRLGLEVSDIPFDYQNYRINYDVLNDILSKKNISAIILAPSDIIFTPEFDSIKKTDTTKIIYDATQTLGLMASGKIPNSFTQASNVILTGGTHKTLPGPTCGLILANDEAIINEIDLKVSPIFVRNPQPHQIASLLLTLIEFLEYGEAFMTEVQQNANYLGALLENKGFKLAQRNGKFSETHQLFLSMTELESDTMNLNARRFRITLDRKDKKIYGASGIRIGVQTLTRYGWTKTDFEILADLLWKIKSPNPNSKLIKNIIDKLPKKKQLRYSLDPSMVS